MFLLGSDFSSLETTKNIYLVPPAVLRSNPPEALGVGKPNLPLAERNIIYIYLYTYIYI